MSHNGWIHDLRRGRNNRTHQLHTPTSLLLHGLVGWVRESPSAVNHCMQLCYINMNVCRSHGLCMNMVSGNYLILNDYIAGNRALRSDLFNMFTNSGPIMHMHRC